MGYHTPNRERKSAFFGFRSGTGVLCSEISIEVKLGGKAIEEGAAHLKKISADIKAEKAPSFLMVITATGQAYKRPDGVYVVPLNCLKK